MFNLSDILGNDKIVPVTDKNGNLKVWNPDELDPKVLARVSKHREARGGVNYIIVYFNAPGDPPSNDIGYKYLAPENNG